MLRHPAENHPTEVDLDELLFEQDNAPEEDETNEGFAPDRPQYEIVDAHLWWLQRQTMRKTERNARGVR
jgi:hypothetical protein